MTKVAIIKGNAYNATKKALEMTDFEKTIKGKSKIVIKPNLTTSAKANDGITTDVNVIRAILDQIPKPEKVVIAEGPGGASADYTFKNNGYYELKEEYGIKIIDTNFDEFFELAIKKPLTLKKIKISKTVFSSDFLISAAKLKIHSVVNVTGSLKNLMGICPREQKLRIHCFLPHSLVDLISVKPPDFGVIDGIVANEIEECVPHPIKMGIILTSKDCVALDAVASDVMNVRLSEVPYILELAKRGYGNANLNEINVVGEKIENIRKNFKRKNFNLRSYGHTKIGRLLIKFGLLDQFYNLAYRIFR